MQNIWLKAILMEYLKCLLYHSNGTLAKKKAKE
jgi:hypothetical protein